MEQAKEPSLDNCLNLLRGNSDEQRLVGLLLVTKFVKGDDLDTVRTVFNTIGFQFLDRLIKTGIGQVGKAGAEQRSYLHLALSILAAFCRVPELASLDKTISKVPVIIETLANKNHEAATGDCFELLLLISTTSEKGLRSLDMPKAVCVVANRLRDCPSDAPWLPVAIKFLHCLLTRIFAENTVGEYVQDLLHVVPPVAKVLYFQQDIIKFEALSILYSLLVSDISPPIRIALGGSSVSHDWALHARTGLGQILHSRVAIEQKHLVLELAQSIVEVVGDAWLVGPMIFPADTSSEPKIHPPDRFFVLMVETLRVESAVLLNEVARSSFDPGEEAQASGGNAVKERRLTKCFDLLESVINIVAEVEDQDENKMDKSSLPQVDEKVLQKTVVVLDEVIGLVLELLEDAEAHNQYEGKVIEDCIRITCRYLAEAPSAHSKRCLNLMGFMLSVTTKDKDRPYAVTEFMLPFLTQITLSVDGCISLLACNGHKKLAGYLTWMMDNKVPGALVDSCDVLLNVLTKKNEVSGISGGEFICLLPPLAATSGRGLSKMESTIVSTVCLLVLTLTSEDELRRRPELAPEVLNKILQLIAVTVEEIVKEDDFTRSPESDQADLWDIILSGCVACVKGRPLYPSLKKALQKLYQNLSGGRHITTGRLPTNINSLLQELLGALYSS